MYADKSKWASDPNTEQAVWRMFYVKNCI